MKALHSLFRLLTKTRRRGLLLATAVGLLLVPVLASCDSFLDEQPVSEVSEEDFYRNGEDLVTATNAIYATLQATNDNRWDGLSSILLWYGSSKSDIGRSNSGNHGNKYFRLNGTSDQAQGRAGAIWDGGYNAIMRANTVLQEAPGVEMDQTLKERLIAETKFLRALWYFTLVRVFGQPEGEGMGVPLVTRRISVEEAYETPRAPVDSVYMQIISDLQDAAAGLPTGYGGSDEGRATRGAANTLLGKVYLTREQWQEASTQFQKVINSGAYRLLDNYADLWGLENENNDEFIFTVEHESGLQDEGARFTRDAYPRSGAEPITYDYGGLGVYTPSMLLMDRLDMFTLNNPLGARSAAEVDTADEGDLRSLWYQRWYPTDPNYSITVNDDGDLDVENINYSYSGGECAECYSEKFRAPPGTDGLDSPLDWAMFRYADVLLMQAEALNEINGGPTPQALEYLNRVRTRAGLEPYENLSYEQFWERVQRERVFELGIEGKRWWDLRRTPEAHGGTDRWLGVMRDYFDYIGAGNADPEPHEIALPLPISVLERNPDIEQTPGYERPIIAEE